MHHQEVFQILGMKIFKSLMYLKINYFLKIVDFFYPQVFLRSAKNEIKILEKPLLPCEFVRGIVVLPI